MFGKFVKSVGYRLLPIRTEADVNPVADRELNITAVGVGVGLHFLLGFMEAMKQSSVKFCAINKQVIDCINR